MNVNIALIRTIAGTRQLGVLTCNDVPPQYPADLSERIILSGMPTELTTIDFNAVLATIKDGQRSYSACIIDTSTGDDMFVGFSIYSMYAAIGAAALKEFEENDAVIDD